MTFRPSDVDALAWPASRIAEALNDLAARQGGRTSRSEATLPPPPIGPGHDEAIGAWLESVSAWMGLEALAVNVTYEGVQELLTSGSPCILRRRGQGEDQFLVLVSGAKRCLTLLGRDLERHRVPKQCVVQSLVGRRGEDVALSDRIDRIVEQARLPRRWRAAAHQAMFRELRGEWDLGTCWLLRPVAGAPLRVLAREARLGQLLGGVAVLHVAEYVLWLLAWWLLGWMSVRGRFDAALFWAWTVILLVMVPLRIGTEAAAGTLSIRAGILLKRRLLAGAFRLDPHEVRQWGVGQLLGRVMEAEAVESLAVSGGLLGLTASVELLVTLFVLGTGAGHWLHVALLLAALGLASLLAAKHYRRQRDWTEGRLQLTNELVENMIGHRTRLAQQPPEQWHREEDEALNGYLGASRQMDRQAAALAALVPRGWLMVGLLGLAPAFVANEASTASLAVGLGGVILAYRALRNLVEGGFRLANAWIAWQRIQRIVAAAGRVEPIGRPRTGLATPANARPLITARDLVFRHRGRSQPVLRGVDLTIHSGERLLLTGSSGGGKSTLAALLAGSITAESGLLLLQGLDRETLGATNWRRLVVLSPQFHENYVLMGPLSFNLLMGRHWPPTPGDLDEAEQICRELGLGPLLDRMPAGMAQLVGETGWQLSHGEKSRLYIARALLQRGDLVVLDESFAALDPPNLQMTLRYVLDHAPSVLVIAHP